MRREPERSRGIEGEEERRRGGEEERRRGGEKERRREGAKERRRGGEEESRRAGEQESRRAGEEERRGGEEERRRRKEERGERRGGEGDVAYHDQYNEGGCRRGGGEATLITPVHARRYLERSWSKEGEEQGRWYSCIRQRKIKRRDSGEDVSPFPSVQRLRLPPFPLVELLSTNGLYDSQYVLSLSYHFTSTSN